MKEREVIELKVAGRTAVNKLAGAIVKNWEEGKDVKLVAIGAGPVNQAVKSATIARSMFASKGKDVTLRPGFSDIEIDGEKRTAMTFEIIVD